MPVFVMLVGAPASGKSTFREVLNNGTWDDFHNISTDDYIEEVVGYLNSTYSDVFGSVIGEATIKAKKSFLNAIQKNENIVVDQTNMSVKARHRWLGKIPPGYTKIALYFPVPERSVWENRLNSRPGKVIPKHILDDMLARFEMPTVEEGFDHVETVTEETFDEFN